MKVYVKQYDEADYFGRTRAGFIISSKSSEETAEFWAKPNYEIVEFPDTFNIKIFDLDDRMNNKIFKVTTDVKRYEDVTFDLYAKSLLDYILSNGKIENGWLSDMTSKQRGEIIYTKGEFYRKWEESQNKQYITKKDLTRGQCYESKNCVWLFIGAENGQLLRMTPWGYVDKVKSVKCIKAKESDCFKIQDLIDDYSERLVNKNYHNKDYLQKEIQKFKEYQKKFEIK